MWRTDKVQEADLVAEMAHRGQTRWDGKTPYITHPRTVAKRVKTKLEKQVALLHDVVEDTAMTMQDLADHGFDKRVLDAITAITKGNRESYTEYLERVAANKLATTVKIEDIGHNLESLKKEPNAKKNRQRKDKYELAIEYLKLKQAYAELERCTK